MAGKSSPAAERKAVEDYPSVMSSKQQYTLPKQIIIKKSTEIETIFKLGKRISFDLFNLYVYESGQTGVAFLVSKKIGNAVKRNKMKRLFREAYRLNKSGYEGKQIIFVIKKYADEFHRISEDVKSINI